MWNLFKKVFGLQRKALPSNDPHFIKEKMDRLFTWVDQSKDDKHKSYIDEYYHNIPFKDDCDGYATTVALVLNREGYPLRNIYLVNCYTFKGVYHQVCMLSTKDEILVFDNLLDRVVTVGTWMGFVYGNKPDKIKCLLTGKWEKWHVPYLRT